MSDAQLIFADNNATTPVAPEVVAAMRPYFGPEYFNPSSMYEPALRVAGALKASRKTVAEFLGGVEPAEVLFTSCATESNNTAIFGVAAANPARKHVLTSAVEHPAVLEVCRERPYFEESALREVRKFLEDPVSWSGAHGGVSSAEEAKALMKAKTEG